MGPRLDTPQLETDWGMGLGEASRLAQGYRNFTNYRAPHAPGRKRHPNPPNHMTTLKVRRRAL